MEIEKKFRLKFLPENMENCKKVEIEQVYLNTFPTIRLRRWNKELILTVKTKAEVDDKKGVLLNHEAELPLSEEEYENLSKKAEGYPIKKTRYLLPLSDGKMAELDVFHGRLEGLSLVEVEFKSVEEAEAFCPPLWFGGDVSEDKRYRNTFLSQLEEYKKEDFE